MHASVCAVIGKKDVPIWNRLQKRPRIIDFWNIQVYWHFKHHEPSAIFFLYILEKEDVSWADIYKAQQLKTKRSWWINNTAGERKKGHLWF